MADSNQTTIIGADTKIKGEMSFEATARLLGQFEGKINAKGELQVADSATCRAAVEANKVVVDGVIEGNVAARERIELNAKAKMKGDITSARLIVAEGASLVGHVTVGPEAGKAGPGGGAASGGAAVEVKPAATQGDAKGDGKAAAQQAR